MWPDDTLARTVYRGDGSSLGTPDPLDAITPGVIGPLVASNVMGRAAFITRSFLVGHAGRGSPGRAGVRAVAIGVIPVAGPRPVRP